MFAIVAFFCFLFALFNLHLGSINLVTLGLMFLALQMIAGGGIGLGSWIRRRPQS